MANNYNSNPISLVTDIATSWRALQTLNTGNLPSTNQQFSGVVTRQWGFRVSKITLTATGAITTTTVQILDPNDSTILFTADVPTAASAGVFVPMVYDFESMNVAWRDFKTTGISTGVNLLVSIWYRP